MSERKNLLQTLVEKPKQSVINLASLVKTRLAECQQRERQKYEIYMTTPPKIGESNTRVTTAINYGVSTCIDYTEQWSNEQSRWTITDKKGRSLR